MHYYNRLKKFLLSKAVLPVSASAAVAFLVLASVVYVENDTAALIADITNTVPQTQQVGGLFGACGSIFGTCQADVYGAIGINPQIVASGQTANLYWNSWGADYCYLSGGRFGVTTQVGVTGNVATDLNAPGSIATYGLRCYNTGGASAGTSPQYYASYTTCSAGQVVGSSGCAAPPVTPPVNDITVECSAVNELGCPGVEKNNVAQITKPLTGSKIISVNSAHYGGDNATLAASAIVQIVGNGTMTSVNPDNYPYAPGSYSNAQVSRHDNNNPYHSYVFTITPTTPAGAYYFYAVTASNAYPWNKYPPTPGGWMNIASINVVENPAAGAPTNLVRTCNAANTQATLTWNSGPGAQYHEVVVDDPTTTHVQQGLSTNCSSPTPTATGAPGYNGSCGLSGTGIRADFVYSRPVSSQPNQAVVNITPGKTYNWTVQGSNASGFGTASGVQTLTCGAGPATPPNVTLNATVSGAAATGLKVGQTAVLTGTYAAASGDTLTQTGIADNTSAYLVGGAGAVTPRTYSFTPTAAGTFIFHGRAATTKIPTAANYVSRTLTVCSAAQNWNGTACVAAGGPTTLGVAATGNPSEPSTTGSFTLTRGGSTSQPMDLTFTILGSATRNTDYSLYAQNVSGADCIINPGTPNDVRIPLGLSSCKVRIDPINDSTQETGGETITFTLSAAPTGYTLSPASATATLGDDDTDICPDINGQQSTVPPQCQTPNPGCIPTGYTWDTTLQQCKAPSVPTPTLTITGNNQSGQVAAQIGQPVVIRGTYAVSQGDTLIFTALNDNNNNALPGVPNTTATSPKTYTFTPTGPGTFVFYPAVRTAAYPSWNNYGQALYINVACPAGQIPQGNGGCVPGVEEEEPVQCGAHQVLGNDGSCTCDIGYTMDQGQCVQRSCPGQNEVNWPSCTCTSGYVRDGGTNMCIREAVLNIQVNSGATARVRKGNTVSLTWSASGVTSGSCTVSSNTAGVLSTGISGSLNPVVGSQTTYTLRCLNDAGGAVSKTATVTLIPTVDEI